MDELEEVYKYKTEARQPARELCFCALLQQEAPVIELMLAYALSPEVPTPNTITEIGNGFVA